MCGSGRQLQAAQGLQGRRQPRPRLIWAAVSAVLCYRVQHASDSMKAALPRAHTSGAVSISTATGSAWSISTIIVAEFLACWPCMLWCALPTSCCWAVGSAPNDCTSSCGCGCRLRRVCPMILYMIGPCHRLALYCSQSFSWEVSAFLESLLQGVAWLAFTIWWT